MLAKKKFVLLVPLNLYTKLPRSLGFARLRVLVWILEEHVLLRVFVGNEGINDGGALGK